MQNADLAQVGQCLVFVLMDGKLTRASIRSQNGRPRVVRYGGKNVDLKIPASQTIAVGRDSVEP